ncbi:MAG: invasion protein regulator, partial [Lacunisphaera sp.]|nr:invasion protein regulator [Lacunisphaera sp.]
MSAAENKAVFLSYASQDAGAAKRICDILRAAGVEVWFDQSELVGGDAWDAKIRKQIKECALLIPIISANTQQRTEGYFRLEWRLADQRTHLMAKGRAFLLPVVIDDTRDAGAHVPDSFTEVQWTRLPSGEASAAFAARVEKLLGGESISPVGAPLAGVRSEANHGRRQATSLPKPKPGWLWAALAILAFGAAYFIFKPHRGPEEVAKVAAPLQNAGSKPEVAALLARVRAGRDRTDVLRTELDTMAGLLGQAAKLDPTDASVWAEWALLDCRYMNEYYDVSPARRDAARQHAAQAAGLDPARPDVRLAQAFVMQCLSNDVATLTEAIKLLRPLLEEIPQNGEVPLELGWLEFYAHRTEAALAWFDRTAKVPGYASRAHFAKAKVLVFTGQTKLAGPEFDLALAAERAAKILLWKSYILMSWDDDLVAARRVLDEVPPQVFVEDMPAITRYYLECLSRNYDQAVAAIRAVPHDYLQSAAYSGPAGYFTGEALARGGKSSAAELERRSALAVVERRLAAEPNDQDLLQFKALLQAALGDRAAGLRTWKAMQELYPINYDASEQALRMALQPPAEAFDWVEQKVAKGANIGRAAQLRLDPVYDQIRSDPRFPALLARAEADPRLSPNAKATKNVTGDSSSAKAAEDLSGQAPDQKSVAVLAFANLSDDKANEYFSDGISEELLNVLAKIPGLKVSARTSAFYFKGKEVPIPEIARQLGVAYVVEGSVRKSGDKVRITAQLIKAADGFHVWSDTFTRELKDIFAVQDEIAGLIAKNLQLKMGVVAPESLREVNPEAHRLVLEGRHYWNLRTTEGFTKAEAAFMKAITLDPQFAQAHAGLADVLITQAIFQSYAGVNVAAATVPQEEIRQALALNPVLAEAYPAAGAVLMWEGRLAEAEQEFQKAIALNSNYALAHHWYSLVLEL